MAIWGVMPCFVMNRYGRFGELLPAPRVLRLKSGILKYRFLRSFFLSVYRAMWGVTIQKSVIFIFTVVGT